MASQIIYGNLPVEKPKGLSETSESGVYYSVGHAQVFSTIAKEVQYIQSEFEIDTDKSLERAAYQIHEFISNFRRRTGRIRFMMYPTELGEIEFCIDNHSFTKKILVNVRSQKELFISVIPGGPARKSITFRDFPLFLEEF